MNKKIIYGIIFSIIFLIGFPVQESFSQYMGSVNPDQWSIATESAVHELSIDVFFQNSTILKESIKTRISKAPEDSLPPTFHVRILYDVNKNEDIRHMDSVYKVDFGASFKNPDNATLEKIYENEYLPPNQIKNKKFEEFESYLTGMLQNIMCRQGFENIIKNSDGSSVCVKPESILKLVERGWAEKSRPESRVFGEPYLGSIEKFENILPLNSSLRLINVQFDYEKEIIKAVQEYRGKDGKGQSIVELLQEEIEEKYSQNELNHPDTEMGWHGYGASSRELGSYHIYFTIKTPDEKSHYLWGIKSTLKNIFPTTSIAVSDNQKAIDILYMVEEN
ncbi:MAG TPA: hypothetical protein VMW74_02410 [Nitrosopumilaceae archaeon]|nr:hypothetical protein [Nitrosopumilaceae archaeon]